MADRTALTPIEIAENGNADCAVGTKYSAVADLVAGGAKVAYPKDGKLLIHVKNTAAANKAVTIKAGAGPGKSQGDLAVTVADFAEEISGTAPYVYQMKKPQKGKCFFLENNRCSVYESRPLICRFFPFALKFNQDSGKYVFSYTLECPTVNKGKAMAKKDFEELFALANERLP
jgi:Fe-S-cluster containining protein